MILLALEVFKMKGCSVNIFCKCDPVETYTTVKKIKDSTDIQIGKLFDKIKQLEVYCSETREIINALQKKEPEVEVEVITKSKK